jgi:hypothetical protein
MSASSYTIGTPYYRHDPAGGGFWLRLDTFHTDDPVFGADLDGNVDAFHALGPDDLSPAVIDGRDATRCAWCWLHYGHTQAYHEHEIASYEAARQQEAANLKV